MVIVGLLLFFFGVVFDRQTNLRHLSVGHLVGPLFMALGLGLIIFSFVSKPVLVALAAIFGVLFVKSLFEIFRPKE
jgi:hypothetical protein